MTTGIKSTTAIIMAIALSAGMASAQPAKDHQKQKTVERVQTKKARSCKTVSQQSKDRFGKMVVIKKKVCK